MTFTLTVPAEADYYLWVHVKGMAPWENSFYVAFDAQPEIAYEIAALDGDWTWRWEIVRPKHQPIVPYHLEAGTHTLHFRPRESRAQLDYLVLTDDQTQVPGYAQPCTETPTWSVACLGDSLTHGYPYADTPSTYPHQLGAMLDSDYGPGAFSITNQGQDGYRADQLLSSLQNQDLLGENADVALLLIGGNDLAQETLPDGSNLEQVLEDTVSEVQSIIDLLREHRNADGTRPTILLSTYTPSQDFWQCLSLAAYNEELRSALQGVDLLLTENWDDLFDTQTGRARAELMADALHPNGEGYLAMAENWLAAIKTVMPTVRVEPGWNLLSLPIAPSSTAARHILWTIDGSYDLVYAYDTANPTSPWLRSTVGLPPYVPVTLIQIDETMGLWLRASQPVSLTIRGFPQDTYAIPLESGWNLVGYPLQSTSPITDALASISGSYDLVYAHENTQGNEYWLSYTSGGPESANTLIELTPGAGYWLRATAPCTWVLSAETAAAD